MDSSHSSDSQQRHLYEPWGGIPCQPGGLHLLTPHEAQPPGRYTCSFHQESDPQVGQSRNCKVSVRPSAYVGILSSWSLRECEEIDTIFAAELRRRSKNLRTSQSKNLYQPVREGGLGFQRFSSMVQQRKRNYVHRLLAHWDQWTQFAVQALCARGHPSPYHSSMSSLTPRLSGLGTGYPLSSRMDFRATPVQLRHSGPKLMLPPLSCLIPSPGVSHPASAAQTSTQNLPSGPPPRLLCRRDCLDWDSLALATSRPPIAST